MSTGFLSQYFEQRNLLSLTCFRKLPTSFIKKNKCTMLLKHYLEKTQKEICGNYDSHNMMGLI